MSLYRWLQNLRSALAPFRGKRRHTRQGSHRSARHRSSLEVLEDRLAFSFGWDGTNYSEPPPGVEWAPPSPLLADFTSDGILDRVGGQCTCRSVAVEPGLGDGTFGDPIPSSLWAGNLA